MTEPPTKKAKKENVSYETRKQVVNECSRGNSSYERHFNYRLSTLPIEFSREIMMDALVLANGICVLTFPLECDTNILNLITASSDCGIVFDSSLHQESGEISGKRKKGARKIKMGTKIAQVGDFSLISPVPGQLLEINKSLETDFSLLISQPQGTGYIAVVYPDLAEIPGPHNGGVVKPKNNTCFSFTQTGACSRGSIS